MTLKADFECSYAGETRFAIRDNGRVVAKVNVRRFGNSRMGYNGDYFETGIKKQIGTVIYDDTSKWHDFPSADILALFPGYVGARLIFHPTTPGLRITDAGYELPTVEYQYDGPAPVLCPHSSVSEYLTFVGSAL